MSFKQFLKELTDDWQKRQDFYRDPFGETGRANLSAEERGKLFAMDREALSRVHHPVCDAYVDDDWRLDEPDTPPPPGDWIAASAGLAPLDKPFRLFAAQREAWSGPAPEVRRVWPSVLPVAWNKPLILCGEGLHHQGTVHLRPVKPAGGTPISLAVDYYKANNFRQIYLITEPLSSNVAYAGEFTVDVVNFTGSGPGGYQSPPIPALHTLRIT